MPASLHMSFSSRTAPTTSSADRRVSVVLELALQQVVNGLLVGAIYALMALGLMVILGILRIINMAQGELYMLGGYFCYLASVTLGVGYVPAIILAMIATAGVGVLMDRLAVRPLLRRPFYMVSLPKTRSVRTGDATRPRLHVRRCPRSARSGARPTHPFRAKHEDAIHCRLIRKSSG
jgi:hypothetical protein